MEEFEPKLKNKVVDKELIAKYVYIFVLAVLLIGGISYGYTFFIQNKKIASGTITTANLSINFGDRSISASNLSKPTNDKEGLSEYAKSLTITNQTNYDGRVNLKLTRTSGLALTDMRYALIINGAIQEINNVPSSGEIMASAIMGNETVNVEVRLWPKTTYTGNATTFVGEITPEIKYLGSVASSLSSPAGKYVNFNCSSSCEVWQIVKVESGRLVLTRQADYSGATSRTNSNKYNPSLSFNDNSMITSVSTDNKNVYLAKTVKIKSGSGTLADPYVLINNDFREDDKKVVATITYKNGNTTVGTQHVYYNETNYISQEVNNRAFEGWTDGTNDYVLGDTITTAVDVELNVIVDLAIHVYGANGTLSNVAFEIFSDSSLTNSVGTFTSGSQVYNVELPLGTYYINTTSVPNNYNSLSTPVEKTLTMDNNEVSIRLQLTDMTTYQSTDTFTLSVSFDSGNEALVTDIELYQLGYGKVYNDWYINDPFIAYGNSIHEIPVYSNSELLALENTIFDVITTNNIAYTYNENTISSVTTISSMQPGIYLVKVNGTNITCPLHVIYTPDSSNNFNISYQTACEVSVTSTPSASPGQ